MKKLFTLVLSIIIVSTAFAQYQMYKANDNVKKFKAIASSEAVQTSIATTGTKALCGTDTLFNWLFDGQGTPTIYTSAVGYVAGHNNYGDLAKAEFFSNVDSLEVCGTLIFFGYASDGGGNFTVNIWDDDGAGSWPGTVLASQTVAYSTIVADVAVPQMTEVVFPFPVTINGNFYVGYEFAYAASDTVAAYLTIQDELPTNTAWEQWSDGDWYEMAPEWGGSTWSLGVFPMYTPIGVPTQNDVGVIALLSPTTGYDLTSTETVQVTIRNYGALDASGFDVTYVIDGGTPVTELVSATVPASGNYDFTFAQTADLSAYVDYSFEIYTSLALDENNSNDTLNTIVSNMSLPPGVLWDNTNIDVTTSGIVSQEFGALTPGLLNAADDFDVDVSSGNWRIDSIHSEGFSNTTSDINSFGVSIYDDNSGAPGTEIFQENIISVQNNAFEVQTLELTAPFEISASGKYWLSVYAVYDTATVMTDCRWNIYTGPTAISSEAMLQDETTTFGPFAWMAFSGLGITDPSMFFRIHGGIIVGINTNEESSISIYPNPTTGTLNITNAENADVYVYNILGEVVASINNAAPFSTIDMSALSEGTYIVKILTDENVITKKINLIK